jgi:hypothetical protein
MVKAHLPKHVRRDDRRIVRIAVDVPDTESDLPPKKPPAPSAKQRLRRGRKSKLMK